MPDPVSSMDVEDVLSSIRRLVSEESKSAETRREAAPDPKRLRPVDNIHESAEEAADGAEEAVERAVRTVMTKEGVLPRDEAPQPVLGTPPSNAITDEDDGRPKLRRFSVTGPADQTDGDDQKLVLTAALRVRDEAEAGEDAASRQVFMPRRGDRLHLRPVSEELEPEEAVSEDHAPGMAAETDVEDEASAAMAADASEDVAQADDGAFIGDDGSENPGYEMNAGTLRDALIGGTGSAGSAAGSSGSGAERLKNLSIAPEDSLFDRANREMAANRGRSNRTPPRPVPVGSESGADNASGGFLRGATSATPLSEAEPEVEVDGEPDASGAYSSASPFSRFGSAFRTRPLDEDDDDEAETGAADAAEDAEPSTMNFSDDEASILDEETLRDLVSQMVREELQGELGDRITRNVRKLVRREIQRALASREFE
jgi:hypothetical protein